MTLTTTPGATNADSYASLAQALAYHAAIGNAAWAASTDALREPALRRATIWVDNSYRARWKGQRGVNGRSQALDWPRYGVLDSDGWYVDSATIPLEVTNATNEAALRELALIQRGNVDHRLVVPFVHRHYHAVSGQGMETGICGIRARISL